MKIILFILTFCIGLIAFDYVYLQFFIPFLITVLEKYFWIIGILIVLGFLFKIVGSVLNILVLPISIPIVLFGSVMVYKIANILLIINTVLFTINILDFDLKPMQKVVFLLFFYFIHYFIFKNNKLKILLEESL